MTPLTIDLTAPDLTFLSGHLRMGGANPAGLAINANSRYLTLGGQPWLPVMGEFHFSRYPHAGWRDELLKLKAGGIQVVATYIFWNHHEPVEGRFDWSGDRDLRQFVALCGQLGLYSYPRLGPWAHGEARLGGFPDWLAAKCPRTRQDDPLYLACARRLYAEIAAQLRGLLWKEGGPVIGVQLENELSDQPGHIATLKRLAREAGIDVPLYTMTGWGPCQVPQDEVIPVFGGYPDAPWDRQVAEWARASRKHYFFSAIRDDNTIGADLRVAPGMPDLAHLARYPFGTCELGGGVQVTYHRRPLIAPRDVSAVALCKLGSGANLLGYYMVHGGTHPLGAFSTQQESQDTGYPNDLPVRSYDFQAPLGEFGQLRPHYHRLRRLHHFLRDFGTALAPLPALFPAERPGGLDDCRTLRWAVRSDGRSGFVFINTYQREEGLAAQEGVQFELRLAGETLCFPPQPIAIPAGTEAIWPFHLDLNGVDLRYATAQPVCRLAGEVPVYVFAAAERVEPEFVFEPGVRLVAPRDSEGALDSATETQSHREEYDIMRGEELVARLLVLSEAKSLQCWKASMWGRERLFFSPAGLLFDGDRLRLRASRAEDLWFEVYPPPEGGLRQVGKELQDAVATPTGRFQAAAAAKNVAVSAQCVQAAGPARVVPLGPAGVAQAPSEADFAAAEVWQVALPPDLLAGVVEARLVVDYLGDAARAYLGDELVADDFYYGRPWEIGLRRLAPAVLQHGLTLSFLPLRRDAPLYIPGEWRAQMGTQDSLLQVRAIRLEVDLEAQFELG